MRTVIILTALHVETLAVLRHLSERVEETVKGTVFFVGMFDGWRVAVAEVGPGNSKAASISERAIDHFQPEVALFVGVAGGVKDVQIGDVVIATKVYGYETGKDDESGFRPRTDVHNSAHSLEQRGRALSKSNGWLKRIDQSLHPTEPHVLVGPIAAGEKVIASQKSATAKFLLRYQSDTLAVEMEGRGFLEGAHINAVEACVIRGISDLLSGKAKADAAGSQKRAADAAAAAAFEILAGLNSQGSRQQLLPTFQETPSTFAASAFFAPNDVLARVGVAGSDEVLFSSAAAPDAYFRIIPTTARAAPIANSALREAASGAPLLKENSFGGLVSLNSYGVMAYDPNGSNRPGPADLKWGTQLFPNGELWMISKTMVVRERNWRPSWIPVPFIPVLLFEKLFYHRTRRAIEFSLGHLGLTFPCAIEFGLLRIRGVHLVLNNEEIRGPILTDEVIYRHQLADGAGTSLDAALLKFFEKVHDATGYARPTRAFGFPPDPPSG